MLYLLCGFLQFRSGNGEYPGKKEKASGVFALESGEYLILLNDGVDRKIIKHYIYPIILKNEKIYIF